MKTDDNFDIDKLQTICDTKFDDLYWKVKHNEIPGELVGDIESDEGLVNPYEIIYDRKRVKANKLSVQSRLKAEAYMCFDWPADENAK